MKNFEPGTSRLPERIEAAGKVVGAGFPLGFIIAPIYLHDGWKEGYKEMLEKLEARLPDSAKKDLTFEMIQHRFTKPAKRVIQKNYPMTKLELDETKRKWKWGRYGIGKFVYTTEEQEDIKDTIGSYINTYFPQAKIEYFT
jgi:spore photoproduct lyase